MRFPTTIFLAATLLFSCVDTANAFTNPIIATTSATATVESTTPTTLDTTAPSNPILISPPDGTVTSDNRLEFIWRSSLDNNSNTIIYTLYLNGVATYLGISNLGNSTGNGYAARIDGSIITLRPTTSLLDGSYDWYVTSSDLSGNTSYSTTWNFLIDTTPPRIAITDIDIYHNLTLDSDHPEDFTDLNFDMAGPKTIYFTIYSEPWSTVTLQFFGSDNQLVSQTSWPVNETGVIYPYLHLDVGVYTLSISSFDHGGNTTALPDFTLTISPAQISLPLPALPGISPFPTITIPYTPYSLPSLPATIAKIETKLSLTFIAYLLLAIIGFILLILLWQRKYNIIFLSPNGQPIRSATLYHSIPSGSYTPGVKRVHTPGVLPSPIFVTKRQPNLFTLSPSDHGRLYIPHLNRYSTFTVRLDDTTYIFSLSTKRSLYTVVLG
jgi:hypothetical protein